ncbi:type II secretion system F family protein [Caproiciproducens faecalis]|uniref:Type II secretion system F family protein n=1 Tax=Caproiciproducens faecalis TaxID=2820301 RepID=A0ABS7DNQ0_9FIRM|nr:type II secretion system F family protein [Caproiciproducens faecalis]MBW7572938.1 type II secretion system F family protein [Caproiciproducens faecalis]
MDQNPTVIPRKTKALSSGDISLFCSQVVLLLRAGIPLQEGIGTISENIADEKGKELIHRIHAAVEQHGSLYLALNSTGAFPKYMVNMVNIGEKAGNLDNVLEALALYYERDERLRSSVRGALLYPFILVLMMAAVVSVLVLKVLPIFNEVFLDMGSDISDAAAAVMRAGNGIGSWALVLIFLMFLFLLTGLLLYKTEKGYRWMTGFLSNFPLTRQLSEKIALARFASAVSMLLSSGYDTEQTLELVPGILSNQAVIEKINRCRERMSAGSSFTQALGEADIFPGIYSGMVRVGGKTGSLDSVMRHLAEIYSEDADESVSRAVSIIEPAMVAALSIIIGAILLSVMLPLMGIMSSIG